MDEINFLKKPLPYFISQYGYNGPWEQHKTSWGAPIEPTSSKKAEQYAKTTQSIDKNEVVLLQKLKEKNEILQKFHESEI